MPLRGGDEGHGLLSLLRAILVYFFFVATWAAFFATYAAWAELLGRCFA